MKEIIWIAMTLSIPLLAAQSYMPADLQHDIADIEITDSGSVRITMQLPTSHRIYAEVFGRTNLLEGQWQVLDSWIPTYGNSELIWDDAVRTNVNTFFYMIHDATIDSDGDGYSDWREHYISRTDPEIFDYADEDGDGMHDYWEIKLFGDVRTQDGYDDFDGDGLLNHQELIWVAADQVQMISDPTLYDTDGEGLDDFTELWMHTDPLSVDSDADGRDDAFEVLGSPPTDPINPDILAPIVVLAGG